MVAGHEHPLAKRTVNKVPITTKDICQLNRQNAEQWRKLGCAEELPARGQVRIAKGQLDVGPLPGSPRDARRYCGK